MSIRKYWPFAFVLITLITSANFITPRNVKHSMKVRVTSKGIPEYGLALIGPADSSFKNSLAAALGRSNSEISEEERMFSVFVRNSTGRSVIAYHLTWSLVDASGKTVYHQRSFKDPLFLMENRTQGQNLEGYSIGPKSERLISLVPLLTDIHHPGAGIGGGFFEGSSSADTDSLRRMLEERNTKQLANKLSKDQDHIVSVAVYLDGVFFDDGTFVGPDESQFFLKVKAQVDARHDLYERIQNMFSSEKPPEKILKYVTNFANMPRPPLGGDSSPSQFYDFFTKLYAHEISRIWKASGQEAVSRFVEAALGKPWTSLRKVQM